MESPTSSLRGALAAAFGAAILANTASVGISQSLDSRSPESLGIRSEGLVELSQQIRSDGLDIRSMILLRNGAIAMEWYAEGVTRDHNHNIFSITKSVVSALCGIAIDTGHFESVEDSLGELFPERSPASMKTITLHDLLGMQSGLPQSRGNTSGPSRNLFDAMHQSPDRLNDIFLLEPVSPSGRQFVYSNIDPQLVLSAIEETSGQSALDFAQTRLFDPLAFKNAVWKFPDETGAMPGGYGLRLRSIDLAKFGQLFLEEGRWADQQVISSRWIEQSTTDQTDSGYGYFWWIPQGQGLPDHFAAKGVRGQQILVSPERNLVFVVTSDLPPDSVRTTMNALNQLLTNTVTSEQALPRNPEGEARLREELETASRYAPKRKPSIPVSRLPAPP